ncbi:MAG: hypothetical protein SHS37scaffold220_62 [Phage 67_12]|nr:MAG: hypothetical protein SHS37scaffold220_62 [Phage 67_12]
MTIQTQTFSQIVSNAVTAIQGAASQLVDMTVGSVLRSVVEAVAAIELWLQGIALQIASLTRFATSSGADADSWAADYNFTRLAAQAASGSVTFSRFTGAGQVTIPLGAVVQTADGSQKYTVIADPGQAAYSATLNAYVLGVGVTSAAATVLSTSAAAAGNAVAGVINTIGSALVGIDTVTNPAGFTTGADAESDAAFRARFVSYISALSKGTRAAVGNAISSVQQGMNYTITEDLTYGGAYQLGYFFAVVDDGSGHPSGTLLSTISNAIDAVRPIGSTFGVFAPVVVTANVAMTLTTAAGYVHASVVALVNAALTAYINALPLGTSLPYSRLALIAYGASPGVLNVTAITLNSGTADLTATPLQAIKCGTLTTT